MNWILSLSLILFHTVSDPGLKFRFRPQHCTPFTPDPGCSGSMLSTNLLPPAPLLTGILRVISASRFRVQNHLVILQGVCSDFPETAYSVTLGTSLPTSGGASRHYPLRQHAIGSAQMPEPPTAAE